MFQYTPLFVVCIMAIQCQHKPHLPFLTIFIFDINYNLPSCFNPLIHLFSSITCATFQHIFKVLSMLIASQKLLLWFVILPYKYSYIFRCSQHYIAFQALYQQKIPTHGYCFISIKQKPFMLFHILFRFKYSFLVYLEHSSVSFFYHSLHLIYIVLILQQLIYIKVKSITPVVSRIGWNVYSLFICIG